ncbi:hypothetical protein NDU88_008016 [Pleurodeles waltl]|uniref:Uncharacterized protein n=1 Tax=Pleurodeles waltl TaxID=8319 RepID=A0AAV7U1C9_PLEWA|nr:hypothetical protein NDU88_008016 [Pleurodeles waltl]
MKGSCPSIVWPFPLGLGGRSAEQSGLSSIIQRARQHLRPRLSAPSGRTTRWRCWDVPPGRGIRATRGSHRSPARRGGGGEGRSRVLTRSLCDGVAPPSHPPHLASPSAQLRLCRHGRSSSCGAAASDCPAAHDSSWLSRPPIQCRSEPQQHNCL